MPTITNKSYASDEAIKVEENENNVDVTETYSTTGDSSIDGGGSYYKYFKSVNWVRRSDGWTLSIETQQRLRNTSAQDARYAFEILYSYHKNDKLWNNTESMRNQFMCHYWNTQLYQKTTWNIEPWKKSHNRFTCN